MANDDQTDNGDMRDSALRWLRRVALLLSAWFVFELIVLVLLRIGHPYLLEWQEGAMVDQVLRILAGHPLYVAPTLEFVPQIYPPLYFYTSAAVTAVIGEGFVPLRVVSVTAALGTVALMVGFVMRETRDSRAALLAVGFFAATFPLSAAFLDIGRVDTLFLFFCMSAVYLARSADSQGRWIAVGSVFWLAFLTKQQASVVVLAFTIYALLAQGPKAALSLAGSFMLLAGSSAWLFNQLSDGWYVFYLFSVPSGHAFFWPMLWGYWWMDLIRPLPLACVASIAWLFVCYRRDGALSETFLFWLMLLGSGVGMAWTSRLHWGGASNVVMPAYLVMALAWGVAISRWMTVTQPGALRPLLVSIVCVMQLAWLVYDPRPLVPGEDDVRAGDAFVEALAGLDGEVLASWHGYLPRLAGKRVYAHRSAVHDVMRSHDGPVKEVLRSTLVGALDQRVFGALVIDQPYFVHDYMTAALERNYRRSGRMLENGLEIGGLLGYRHNPHLYLPVESKAGPPSEGRSR